MRILAIADRPPLRPLREILAEEHIDIIVTLGDLDMNDIGYLEFVNGIPKLGVYGNHCSGSYMESLGITNMHLHTEAIGGVTFGGFEGCVRYKNSPYAKMYTQEESKRMLEGFPRVDVMLVHCPPYGINDDPSDISHVGYEGLRDYVIEKKPRVLFHGHTYPETPQTSLGGTRIEYVYGHKIVDL